MARWRKTTLDAMTKRIEQLGVERCPVCRNGTMNVLRLPVVLSTGSFFREAEHRTPNDPDTGEIYMAGVACPGCGHTMLFDSECLVPEDERSLVKGMSESEEAAMEAGLG